MSSAAWSLLFHVDLVPPNWLIPTPVPSEEWYRNRRQVVAPDWLRGPVLPVNSQSAVVRVTPQNLQETAAIRASIQKAINEGSYVVATDPQQVGGMG
ncbi:uncharacterized protein Dwil_GK27485 [Drosophila willistoni]|uniref:Uncharacterized protein n=1 Tax=Drosophila willistoni TaxID=7260 RepID=A0A0Q9WU17_DROWI|nr:uncharacterized protein Dwil_GK27485 [Drosophila willistoni]